MFYLEIARLRPTPLTCVSSVLFLISLSILTACAPSTNRFDMLGETTEMGFRAPRAEVADQGSGGARGTTHAVRRVTVGGSYLRQRSVSSGGFAVRAGLHGNPQATR